MIVRVRFPGENSDYFRRSQANCYRIHLPEDRRALVEYLNVLRHYLSDLDHLVKGYFRNDYIVLVVLQTVRGTSLVCFVLCEHAMLQASAVGEEDVVIAVHHQLVVSNHGLKNVVHTGLHFNC